LQNCSSDLDIDGGACGQDHGLTCCGVPGDEGEYLEVIGVANGEWDGEVGVLAAGTE